MCDIMKAKKTTKERESPYLIWMACNLLCLCLRPLLSPYLPPHPFLPGHFLSASFPGVHCLIIYIYISIFFAALLFPLLSAFEGRYQLAKIGYVVTNGWLSLKLKSISVLFVACQEICLALPCLALPCRYLFPYKPIIIKIMSLYILHFR